MILSMSWKRNKTNVSYSWLGKLDGGILMDIFIEEMEELIEGLKKFCLVKG